MPSNHASAHMAAFRQTAAASGHAVQGPDLPPAALTPAFAMAGNRQEFGTSDLCAQDSSRQPLRMINADSSAATAVDHLSKANDPPLEKPAQHAAQQRQLPVQADTPPLALNTQAQQPAETAKHSRSEGSSVDDQCSSSGSFDRLGMSQNAGHVSNVGHPVSSGSLDTAASSSSKVAAAPAAGESHPAASVARSRQHSSSAVQSNAFSSNGMSNGSGNGSPTGSRATAASTSVGRAGLLGDAPGRDSGAGVGTAGRQKKSKGPSIEVSC